MRFDDLLTIVSSDEEGDDPVPQKGMSHSLGMRMQKKLLGMTAKKSVVKAFIDDNSGELLDHLHDVARQFYGDQKTAKKFIKDMLKVIVKVGFLYNKQQLNDEELRLGNTLQSKLKMAILTVISYHDVAFTFDAAFLVQLFDAVKDLLQKLIARHLTDKSKERVENVFRFFSNTDMLTALYTNAAYKSLFEQIITCLNKLIETNGW